MKQFFLLFLPLLFVSQAHAGILLEPYLGYHTGNYKVGNGKYDMNGPTFGGRVGYQNLGLFLGVDYMLGKWKDDASDSRDASPTDLGLFVGYEFPVMLRVYATYAFDSELKLKGGAINDKYEGTSMKFGLGFTALPMVSVNLEYITGTYDEANGVSLASKLKTSMYGLSVSLPLVF